MGNKHVSMQLRQVNMLVEAAGARVTQVRIVTATTPNVKRGSEIRNTFGSDNRLFVAYLAAHDPGKTRGMRLGSSVKICNKRKRKSPS